MPSHRYVDDPSVRLDPNGMLAGWAFGVPEVFFPALDIRPRRYRTATDGRARTVWLRGDPPVRSFKRGDVFYEPPEVRAMPWSAGLRRLRRWVQVVEATADRWNPAEGGTVVPGSVTFFVTEYASGKPAMDAPPRTVSQSEFEALLRTGVAQ